MSQQPLPIAVLGTGSIGSRHLRAARTLASINGIGISMRAARRSQLSTEGFSTAKDLDDAAQAGAQACVIATDTSRHATDALEAMKRGLHVLIEKPLAANAGEAVAVLKAATRRQKGIWVACCLRYCESLNTFRSLLERLGTLHSARIECQSYLPDWRPERDYRESYSARAQEGGVLRDLIHEIDYAGWIFGWPERIQARLANKHRLGIKSEEEADLCWETPDAVSVSVRLDYLGVPSRRRMIAFGEKGTLEWDGIAQTVQLSLKTGKSRTVRSAQTRDQLFENQLRAFVKVYKGRTDNRLATGADGVKALAVCDAARESSRSLREVRVDYRGL